MKKRFYHLLQFSLLFGASALIGQDVVILSDGTVLEGKVEELPKMGYSFGKVPLPLEGIAMVQFQRDANSVKQQVKLKNGLIYYANAEGDLAFEDGIYDPDSIEAIVLNERPAHVCCMPRTLQLEMTNGDLVPVRILRGAVPLKRTAIGAEEIVELNISGGLTGRLERDGVEVPLSMTVPLEDHLAIEVLPTSDRYLIPWASIAKVGRSIQEKELASARKISDGGVPSGIFTTLAKVEISSGLTERMDEPAEEAIADAGLLDFEQDFAMLMEQLEADESDVSSETWVGGAPRSYLKSVGLSNEPVLEVAEEEND